MKVLKLNKANFAQMTPKQKARYRKMLAYVREYTRDRREWNKKIKSGELAEHVTLQQYRDVLRGKGLSVGEMQTTGNRAIKELQDIQGTEDIVGKMERLLTELKGIEQRKAEIISIFRKFA